MSLQVPAEERGVIRVFAYDGDELTDFTEARGSEDADIWPLREALGCTYLDEDFIESYPVADLDPIGLDGYLEQGYGVDPASLGPVREAFAGNKGQAIVIFSDAFGGFETTLSVTAPLRLIATLTEAKADNSQPAIPSQAAAPYSGTPSGKKRPSDAAMSGRIASLALFVLFALVAVMVWVGG